MTLSINTNIASLNSQRALSKTNSILNTASERLSTGFRINSAKDDAAGLAIATRMDSITRGQVVAIRNAQDAISLTQVAEAAVGNVGDMLLRMRELAVQAANGTNSSTELDNLDLEYQQLALEVTRTLDGTKFNGQSILGADAGALTFQIGEAVGDTITVTTSDLAGNSAISNVTGGDLTSSTNATTAMGYLDSAIDYLNTQRATLGAAQNRFEAVINNLESSVVATKAARGRIMDANFAQETEILAKTQVIQQAGVAMLAHANQNSSLILSLLNR